MVFWTGSLIFMWELDFFFFLFLPSCLRPHEQCWSIAFQEGIFPWNSYLNSWIRVCCFRGARCSDRQTERLPDSCVLLKQCAQLGVWGVGGKSVIKPPYIYIPVSYFLHHPGVSVLWDIICQNIWISLAAINCCCFWTVESVSGTFGSCHCNNQPEIFGFEQVTSPHWLAHVHEEPKELRNAPSVACWQKPEFAFCEFYFTVEESREEEAS